MLVAPYTRQNWSVINRPRESRSYGNWSSKGDDLMPVQVMRVRQAMHYLRCDVDAHASGKNRA
jgi:hypothetical protein